MWFRFLARDGRTNEGVPRGPRGPKKGVNRDNTRFRDKIAYVGGPSFRRRPWPYGERCSRAPSTSATLFRRYKIKKPSPVSPLWNQLQNIAIIGEKCTSEEEIKLSISKNVTNLHQVLCWCGLTNMGNIKRLPAACPVQQERQRSDIRNPQLLTKMSEAKRAFRSQGRPVECVEEEKVWIARKSWHRIKKLADWGLKSRQSMTHKYDTMWTRVMKAFPKTSSSRRSKSIIQIPCLIYISFFQDVPQNKLAKLRRHAGRVHFAKIQCGRSSISQRWGADLRPQCTVKIKKTLKTFTKRSKELPEIFKIVLRPLWWATGSEQPSPPLHPLTARGLLNSFQLFLVASDFFPPSTQYFSFFGKSYFCWTESWTHGRSMAELMHSIHPTPAVYDCCFFWLHWISFHQAHNISHF